MGPLMPVLVHAQAQDVWAAESGAEGSGAGAEPAADKRARPREGQGSCPRDSLGPHCNSVPPGAGSMGVLQPSGHAGQRGEPSADETIAVVSSLHASTCSLGGTSSFARHVSGLAPPL